MAQFEDPMNPALFVPVSNPVPDPVPDQLSQSNPTSNRIQICNNDLFYEEKVFILRTQCRSAEEC